MADKTANGLADYPQQGSNSGLAPHDVQVDQENVDETLEFPVFPKIHGMIINGSISRMGKSN
ncbi:MAG: hypothetical protein P8Z76_20040 [Alphaproteobacteria bacterium]|jgi:hypothetical protein